MPDTGWLSKTELNALYYETVAGDISFMTEAEGGGHSNAVARLIGARAAGLGRSRVRVLEIGANNCAFAHLVIEDLWTASGSENELTGVEYVAVEYSRPSLEQAVGRELEERLFENVVRGGPAPPGRPALVARIVENGEFAVELDLVHSEANEFMRGTREPFDFVIFNELLDDMPYRAFFADGDGRRLEAVPRSRGEGSRWTVRVDAEPAAEADLDGMPADTLTARSPESIELVAAAAELLRPGGLLLLHDYGFTEHHMPLGTYELPPPSLPPFAELAFPDGAGRFPRGFFRVFGNEARRMIQVTNDVNFAELTDALARTGTVIVIPHGNAIVNLGRRLQKGDGVFLSEFGELTLGDDLDALLAGLAAGQARIREEFTTRYAAGRGTFFVDLIYVKGEPPKSVQDFIRV